MINIISTRVIRLFGLLGEVREMLFPVDERRHLCEGSGHNPVREHRMRRM